MSKEPIEAVRMTVTIDEEFIPEFNRLKKEKFWSGTKTDVIRYILELGFKESARQQEGA